MIKARHLSLDGTPIADRTTSPFGVVVRAAAGTHKVSARVKFQRAGWILAEHTRLASIAVAHLDPAVGAARHRL